MLKSMTGFGQSKVEGEKRTILVEARSLNSKFLDLSLRTVPLSALQEIWLRNECTNRIQRGKAAISIVIEERENPDSGKSSNIDLVLLARYMESIDSLADRFNQNKEQLLASCLSLPGLFKSVEEIPDEDLWGHIQEGFKKAIEEFNRFRDREGGVIQTEMEQRVESIRHQLKLVEDLAPKRIHLIRSRMEDALEILKPSFGLDSNRLEQELIYYIDKIDFSEEVSRLHTHLVFFQETLKESESNGKKLGFVAQEMGREINTLGSKANDALIQQKVVNMKEELEKIKEQLANIL